MTLRPRQAAKGRRPKGRLPEPLLYKIQELSLVDETTLERSINHWVSQGWKLDGIQFAMRESSKRPSMAFVLFTREGSASDMKAPTLDTGTQQVARQRLARLAGAEEPD